MGNTLTGLIADVYEALDMVAREQVGYVPAVTLSASSDRAAVGQTIKSPVAPASTASDITPGVTPPDDGDQTIGNLTMTISKARRVPIRWNGEEEKTLRAPGGPGDRNIKIDQIAQAFRTLSNEMESDLAAAAHLGASRAAGTAGTTPFAFSASRSGFEDIAETRKILIDNGAPNTDMEFVLGTTAGAKLRSIAQLNRVDAAGTEAFMKQGILIPLQGCNMRESGQAKRHTKGTAASATTSNAGFAVGATSIVLASAGTGTILAGDVITFAGDTNQYMVVTGDADVSGGGTIVLAAPGLRQAIPAAATDITVVATSNRNVLFHRSAIVLATRLPARPENDLAIDVVSVVDDRSGLTFEVAQYPQYRQLQTEVAVAWGVKVFKTEFVANLLG